MPKVIFKGLTYEMQKVSLTKLFKEKLNLPLNSAKRNTDLILDGETVIVETETLEQARDLVEQATALGAFCEIINND